jgi:hypothetical protein
MQIAGPFQRNAGECRELKIRGIQENKGGMQAKVQFVDKVTFPMKCYLS